jgi:predicted anti-sigma-YlaC factor YlaD
MTAHNGEPPARPPDARTCQQVTALLAEYVAGELDPATTQVLEAHLRACRDCIAFLNTYKTTIDATRTLRYEDMPVVLQDEMLNFLRHKLQGTPPEH